MKNIDKFPHAREIGELLLFVYRENFKLNLSIEQIRLRK